MAHREAVEFGEEGVYDAGGGFVEFGAALGDQGVELVEEDYAGDGGAGALEDLAESALGFADVLGGNLAGLLVRGRGVWSAELIGGHYQV